MKLAVAVSSNTIALTHFGKAEFFWIYGRFDEQFELLEIRSNTPGCGKDRVDQNNMIQSVQRIADCDGVVASALGPCARILLLSHNIIPYEPEGESVPSIEEALHQAFRNLEQYV